MRTYYLLFTLPLILVGCASNDGNKMDFESAYNKVKVQGIGAENAVDVNLEPDADSSSLLEEQNFESLIGSNKNKISLSGETYNFKNDEPVSFTAKDMPLGDFIDYILAKILKVNFVIDPKVGDLNNQKVTLNIEKELSKSDFYKVFNDTLMAYDISIVFKDDLFFIYKAANRGHFDKIRVGIGNKVEDVPDGEIIYQLVPLTFINGDAVNGFVSQVTLATSASSAEGDFAIVQGYKNDVVRALRVIQYLDVPAAVGKFITFMPLTYMEPFEFIEQLEELMTIEGIAFGVNVKATALPRHSGIVIHSSQKILVDRVRYWKDKLDTSEATGKERYLLYFPENSKASELAAGLGKLLALKTGASSVTRTSSSSPSTSTSPNSSGNTPSNASSGSNTSVGFASKEISMVSDDNRNALIFYTTQAKYRSLLPVIKQLDVLPAQVMVEAKFIEVTLTDKFNNGVEWAIQKALNTSSTESLFNFNNGSFSYGISGLDYRFALNFLQTNEKIKVLSSPRLLVTDGKSASINVGTEVPVLTTQSNDVDTDRVLQSVQYRATGVDLSISPTVNSKGIVSLKVSQSVSETSENASSGLDSPLILNRSISTEVFAKSGETIILGGLIRENNSENDKKIPLLGDVPLVGRLFNGKSDSKTRTELIVLITPVIVHDSESLSEISDIFKNELVLF